MRDPVLYFQINESPAYDATQVQLEHEHTLLKDLAFARQELVKM